MKLQLSDDSHNGTFDQAVFVMYNCARLSTLFQHFNEAVSEGNSHQSIASHIHCVSEKNIQNCFPHNYVKFY